jgi:hypothetical protein
LDTIWGNKLILLSILTVETISNFVLELVRVEPDLLNEMEGHMFYQVRIYNSQAELKETIAPHELSEAYWRKNLTLEKKIKLVKRARDLSHLEPLEFDRDLFTSKGEPRVQLSF